MPRLFFGSSYKVGPNGGVGASKKFNFPILRSRTHRKIVPNRKPQLLSPSTEAKSLKNVNPSNKQTKHGVYRFYHGALGPFSDHNTLTLDINGNITNRVKNRNRVSYKNMKNRIARFSSAGNLNVNLTPQNLLNFLGKSGYNYLRLKPTDRDLLILSLIEKKKVDSLNKLQIEYV